MNIIRKIIDEPFLTLLKVLGNLRTKCTIWNDVICGWSLVVSCYGGETGALQPCVRSPPSHATNHVGELERNGLGRMKKERREEKIPDAL